MDLPTGRAVRQDEGYNCVFGGFSEESARRQHRNLFLLLAAGTQVPPLQAYDHAGLIADAPSRAEDLASAAGFGAGTVVSIASAAGYGQGCSATVTFGLRGLRDLPKPGTITTSVSRGVTAPADEAVINLLVTSSLTASVDDVSAALAATGISGAKFSGFNTTVIYNPVQSNALNWSFEVDPPLFKVGDTVANLVAAQQAVQKQNQIQSLYFYVSSFKVPHQPCPRVST